MSNFLEIFIQTIINEAMYVYNIETNPMTDQNV